METQTKKLWLVLIIFLASFVSVSAANIITTDLAGNPKTDFSPEEIVGIKGRSFASNSLIIISVLRPDYSLDSGFILSSSAGNFVYLYLLDGITGNYYVSATDGEVTAQTTFTDAAIWTTSNDCGTQSQDVNHYAVGDNVFINGDGFVAGDYDWQIRGQPGGASCDPNQIVASGTRTVNSSGTFCFDAYTVANDDCGEYQVKFGVKGDNYRVEGNACTNNSQCGQPSSELSCQGNNVKNLTTTPLCSGGSCTSTNITTITSCGNQTSALICVGNNIFNSTITPTCSDGSCATINSSSFVRSCGTTTSQLVCIGLNVTNITIIPSCSSGSCSNQTAIRTIRQCAFNCTNGQCIEPTCGNGNLESGEQCDDGNTNNNDACTNSCRNARCGDGIVRTGVEQCDDGNTNDFDGCSSTCQNETITCTRNSDCGTDFFSAPFCSDLNVTKNFTFFTCNNPGTFRSFCSNTTITITEQTCDFRCSNGQCVCLDSDNDGICDTDDDCPNSKPGEPVDQNGCDIFQFCKQFSCGFDCFFADWRHNEPLTRFPNDCKVAVVLRNGIEQQPICVPTEFSNRCAG